MIQSGDIWKAVKINIGEAKTGKNDIGLMERND
jgi:hypothetical protein